MVVASAARAEELRARWATPPPYAPDARPVPCLRPAGRAPHPCPPFVWVCLVQSMAVVGDGRIPGLGWTLQHHGDLVTAPLNSLGGPRRNAAKIYASAYPSPFSTTITAIYDIVATINRHIHHPPMASYRNDALVQDKERAVKQSAEARADEVVTLVKIRPFYPLRNQISTSSGSHTHHRTYTL